ncbi:MAG: DUF4402 domain-containing protein [Ignavibacteriae bacterium]|nr:DUF4402 domain-containing protein [Ignavibacteriota bacterium]MCB9243178.1 DUF4402 domain-containing protein [Ignavibacteriales bacterium]
MKKMKLFLLVTALITLAVSSSSFAQVTANANANVTANLRKGLTIVKDTDMDFGIVQQNPDNSASSTLTPQNGAKFSVSGNASTTINVTLSDATLTMSDPAVTVSTWVMHVTDTGTYTSGSNILTGVNGSTTLSSSGAKTLWLGSTLTATTSATSGVKTGTITVTVAY